jgi:hypothetical protein
MDDPNIQEIATRMVREALEISKEQIDPKNIPRIEHYMIPVFAQGLHRAYQEGRTLIERSSIEKRLASTFIDLIRTIQAEQ